VRRVRLSREINLYIGRGIVSYSLVGFFILDAVMGLIGTVRVTDKYNVPFLLILPLLLKAMGQMLMYTMPVALLFGTSLMAGRLRGDRELLSLTSFGVSPAQLFVPVLLLGGVLSAFSYELNQRVVPHFRYDMRNVTSFVLENLDYLGEGWGLDFSVGPYEIWVHRHNGANLEGVFLTAKGNAVKGPISPEILGNVDTPTYPFYLVAERARVLAERNERDEFTIELEAVSLFVDNQLLSGPKAAEFVQRGHLATFRWYIPAGRRGRGVKDRDRWQLAAHREETYEKWKESEAAGDQDLAGNYERHYHEIVRQSHRRLAMALCCLTFPMCAFAIGMFVRSENRLLPFFVACTVVPANFFGLELFGGNLAEQGILPMVTEQLGNIALVIISVVLYGLSARGPRR
jgi:hypothetical protein